MPKAGNITKGNYIYWRGEPNLVVGKEFYSPGKGAAVVRLKLKSLTAGKVLQEVLKTDEQVKEVEIAHQKVQYLYKTKENFVFMNPHTYEQFEVSPKIIGDNEKYIKEGESYLLALLEGKAIDISLPKKMIFKVIKAENAVKGDTASGSAATKLATLDNGTVIRVPLFIKEGEEVIINTETGEYVGRKI